MPSPGLRAGPCAAVRPVLHVDSWGDLDTPQGFAVDLPAVDCDGAEPAMLIDVPWPGFHAPGLEALSGSFDSPSTGETLRCTRGCDRGIRHARTGVAPTSNSCGARQGADRRQLLALCD